MVTFERSVRINEVQLAQIERDGEKNHRTASEQLCAVLEQAGYSPFDKPRRKEKEAAVP
jgi:hypothetical protein